MQIFCFYKGYCVLLQIEGDFEVDAAAGEVIGAGPLVTVGIGNPEIGVDVIPAYDIESLELQGPLLDVFGRGGAHELSGLAVEGPGST